MNDLAKSHKSRRSRRGESPELLDLTGFPLWRDDKIGIETTFNELINIGVIYNPLARRMTRRKCFFSVTL
jgi:hypothetical protein